MDAAIWQVAVRIGVLKGSGVVMGLASALFA